MPFFQPFFDRFFFLVAWVQPERGQSNLNWSQAISMVGCTGGTKADCNCFRFGTRKMDLERKGDHDGTDRDGPKVMMAMRLASGRSSRSVILLDRFNNGKAFGTC